MLSLLAYFISDDSFQTGTYFYNPDFQYEIKSKCDSTQGIDFESSENDINCTFDVDMLDTEANLTFSLDGKILHYPLPRNDSMSFFNHELIIWSLQLIILSLLDMDTIISKTIPVIKI